MFPRIFQIWGPLWVQSYGLMIAVAFIVFLFVTYRHPVRQKVISSQNYINVVFWSLLVGIIGGRFLYVILNLQEFYASPMHIFIPWDGGLVVMGGILAILFFAPLYLYSIHTPPFPLLDLVAAYAPLMHAIARIGCLLVGCCYGISAPIYVWGRVTFTHPEGVAPLFVALYPTQIYASIASFSIFLILSLMTRLRLKQGVLLILFLIFESISRFCIDFWRGDRGYLYNIVFANKVLHLSYIQLLSAMVFVIATTVLIILLILPGNRYSLRNYGSI